MALEVPTKYRLEAAFRNQNQEPLPAGGRAWKSSHGMIFMIFSFVPGPPNYRWFLVFFVYLKASRNHLLGGTGLSGVFLNYFLQAPTPCLNGLFIFRRCSSHHLVVTS